MPKPYPTTTRRFPTLFLALLSHVILNAAKNLVAVEAARSLIQGAAPGLPQHLTSLMLTQQRAQGLNELRAYH
ncbi:MAG: hypothetical protein ACOYI9_01265 [Candidatus Hydrogenedentales bacterium]